MYFTALLGDGSLLLDVVYFFMVLEMKPLSRLRLTADGEVPAQRKICTYRNQCRKKSRVPLKSAIEVKLR